MHTDRIAMSDWVANHGVDGLRDHGFPVRKIVEDGDVTLLKCDDAETMRVALGGFIDWVGDCGTFVGETLRSLPLNGKTVGRSVLSVDTQDIPAGQSWRLALNGVVLAKRRGPGTINFEADARPVVTWSTKLSVELLSDAGQERVTRLFGWDAIALVGPKSGPSL